MTLRERFEKLEPRERRLLVILGATFAVAIILVGPIALWSMVSTRRAEARDMRDLIDQVYDARAAVAERKSKKDALLARYAKTAPPLAGFLEEQFKEQGSAAAESQDLPPVPHGKRYNERTTVVKVHKIGMLALAKALEKIEQSSYPVVISRLGLKPRAGEPDSYEVDLGISAFDRKADAPAKDKDKDPGGDKDSGKDKEKDQ